MTNIIFDYNNKIGEKAVKAFEKNGFSAKYFSNREEALKYILDLIPKNSTVGLGGSVTIREIGLDAELEKRGLTLYNHWRKGISAEERKDILKAQQTCDVFITSSNALTLDGKIVNIDATGNRVAAMIFGPSKVIIVCGINKLTENADLALKRIKNEASPKNAIRLNRQTPCAQTGTCADCQSQDRICCVTTIIEKQPILTETHVIIIGEPLGY